VLPCDIVKLDGLAYEDESQSPEVEYETEYVIGDEQPEE
jgi:hypothetical protein